MINKSNLWFLTLSSIILVLAVYYIGGPIDDTNMVFSASTTDNNEKLVIEENEVITAMRVEKEEEHLSELQVLQEVLLNTNATIEQKNEAYESIKYLNNNAALEEKLEKNINKEFKVSSFVKIEDTKIKVVVVNKDASYEIANNIILFINEELDSDYYVTVKFE